VVCGFLEIGVFCRGVCTKKKGHASGCGTLGMRDHPGNFALRASLHEPTLERAILDCAASFQEQVGWLFRCGLFRGLCFLLLFLVGPLKVCS